MDALLKSTDHAPMLRLCLRAGEAVETQGALFVGHTGTVIEEMPDLAPKELLWREQLPARLFPRRVFRATNQEAATLWLAGQAPGALAELVAVEEGLWVRARAVFCRSLTANSAKEQPPLFRDDLLRLAKGERLWIWAYGTICEERVTGKLWVRDERLLAFEESLTLSVAEPEPWRQAGLRLVRGSGRVWLGDAAQSDLFVWFEG